MEYDHTQTGYTGVLSAVFLVLVAAVSIPPTWDESPASAVLISVFYILIIALVFWFSRLRVTVTNGLLVVAFGSGKPHRELPLSDIASVHTIRNKWIYGWGIRKVPDGWMYNVWGLDAVEVTLESGKVLRVGTDEPNKLQAAISLSL